MSFQVEHYSWKRLHKSFPDELFDPIGGKEAAKARRLAMGYGVKADTSAVTSSTSSLTGKNDDSGNDVTVDSKTVDKVSGKRTYVDISKDAEGVEDMVKFESIPSLLAAFEHTCHQPFYVPHVVWSVLDK